MERASLTFRDLRADEIEVRCAQAKQNGVSLLLYKDTRTDMNILDETVGRENWQCRFYEHKGILFCSVGINTNYNRPDLPDRWIWKDDAGVESNQEAEKGNASDARKRSCFSWGLGRELYTSPFIWVKAEDCTALKQNGQKWQCFDTFEVEKIVIENKRIVALAIRNTKSGKRCFVWQDAAWKARNVK
jgi:hypothetical protein